MTKIKVVVCGSGNAAHVVTGLASMHRDIDICVFTRDHEKTKNWLSARGEDNLKIYKRDDGIDNLVACSDNYRVTSDPELAGINCDILILAVPAFAHEKYLNLLSPYIGEGIVIVGFPGQNGFEFEVRKVLQSLPVIIMNFESCPWSCRIMEFGKSAGILGAKKILVGATSGDMAISRVNNPFAVLQRLFGTWTEMRESESLLSITLMAINAYSHPPIMYGAWKDWDGSILSEPPLFYYSISKNTANLLTEVTAEGQNIGKRIVELYPDEDMSHFVTMMEWDLSRYGHLIEDKTDQYSVLHTNKAYAKMTHPVIKTEEGFLPDFNQRFLSEDVPFGLITVRGIAELAEVDTPRIDEVIEWSQKKLGKEYLVNGKLVGKDIKSTRAPQAYGYTCLADIL